MHQTNTESERKTKNEENDQLGQKQQSWFEYPSHRLLNLSSFKTCSEGLLVDKNADNFQNFPVHKAVEKTLIKFWTVDKAPKYMYPRIIYTKNFALLSIYFATYCNFQFTPESLQRRWIPQSPLYYVLHLQKFFRHGNSGFPSRWIEGKTCVVSLPQCIAELSILLGRIPYETSLMNKENPHHNLCSSVHRF